MFDITTEFLPRSEICKGGTRGSSQFDGGMLPIFVAIIEFVVVANKGGAKKSIKKEQLKYLKRILVY